ncbi:C-GCAxxG-C-C family protein [Odoribacter sp. Z80]|uniref:C-GCAxxG-C-C family protein n=1 Tax=Odoribacter sp. Z80 TaxID=2304575 RepID=UPI00137B52C0|nr:C-GCAxxG-C-C family protein [Odoribacter sp. Z80]NCE72165.1 C_GCAxxG_C_C family protein [Odoribacter sp. Z80]
MEDRIQKAVELFKQGYNCSQSICAAFADMYGYTEEQALRMSASFGGGIGRMRMTCGAACGMFILAGLETGCTDGKDKDGKEANYRLVQQLADEFAHRNGSLICAELLGLSKKKHDDPVPEARTQEYYKKRPCTKTIEEAARIWVQYLKSSSNGQ